jgi:hypothetical protein
MTIDRPLLRAMCEVAGTISRVTVKEGQRRRRRRRLGITLVAEVGISMIVIVIAIVIPGVMGGIDPGVHPETLDRDQENSIAIDGLLEGGTGMIGVPGISGIATHGTGTEVEEAEQVEEEGGEEDTEIVATEEGEGGTSAHPHLSRWTSNNNAASVVTERGPIHRIMAAMIVADDNRKPHLQLDSGSQGGHHFPGQVSRAKTSLAVIFHSAVRKMVARKIWRWMRVTTRGVSPARGRELKTHPLHYRQNPLRSRKHCPLGSANRIIRSTRHRPAHRSRNPVEQVKAGERPVQL